MDLELTDKVVLVGGASRGIGRGIAHAFAREGAKVFAVARGADDLAALSSEIACETVVADLATADGARTAVDTCVARYGGIDCVVANVGKSFARTASELDDADFAKSLDANLWTSMRIAQLAVPHLRSRGGGSITMIASLFGSEAGGAPGYNVGKAGVVALAKALARDYAKEHIRVNSISPGSIRFPGSGWDRRVIADPEGMASFVAREIPAGRFGTVEEIADVVVFVASVRARWITGANIAVDGGQARAF